MTAPVANPSWALKKTRVRRKIRALESMKAEPGANVAELDAGIAAHQAELVALRAESVRAALGERADRYAHLWGHQRHS
jgi:hypothetical protein